MTPQKEPVKSAPSSSGIGTEMPPVVTLRFITRNLEEIVSCTGMCVIIAVISLNVALRYCLNSSISWAEEIAVIGFSCVIFLGSAAVYKRHMHVGIDFVIGLLPPRFNRAVNYMTGVFLLLFNAYLTLLGWTFSVEGWEKPTSILFIPYFFVNFPICLGFASMTYHSAKDLYLRHRKWYDANVTQRFRRDTA